MQWKLLQWTADLVFVAAVVLVIAFRNKRQARELEGGQIEFTPSKIAILCWVIVLTRLVVMGSRFLLHADGHPLRFANGFLIGAGALLFLTDGLPGRIVIDTDRVAQRLWLGFSKTIIRWDEIEDIQAGRGNTVTITAPRHRKIIHWAILPDRARFLAEVKLHCPASLSQLNTAE